MPDTIDIHASPGTFPMTELVKTGLWASLKPTTHAVLGALWDFHRMYPDACRPSRETLAAYSGVSVPTITRAVTELEEIGLLVVIPPAGPGPNTYKLNWAGLKAPSPIKGFQRSGNQFQRPGSVSDTILVDGSGGKGRGNRVEMVRRTHRHVMPDECILFSANEVAVHSWLQDWKIPHIANVKYTDLGIGGPTSHLHSASTVDFVVGPRLLLECWGMPRSQPGAVHYHKKRALKEKAVAAAGWTLIGVEPGEKLNERHCQQFLDHWAASKIKEAEAVYTKLKNRGLVTTANYGHVLWADAIMDAKARAAGQKPPATPTGLYRIEYIADDQMPGWTYPQKFWQQPVVVLDASAGTRVTPPVVPGASLQVPFSSEKVPKVPVAPPGPVPLPAVPGPAPTCPSVSGERDDGDREKEPNWGSDFLRDYDEYDSGGGGDDDDD
jgi:hypothetical protein